MEPTRKTELRATAWALGLLLALTPQADRWTTSLSFAAETAAQNISQDALSESQTLLLNARRSLMGKDVASAERLVREAAALPCQYGPSNDRPEYVKALIEEFKAANQAVEVKGMTESVRRGLAQNYLNQAEALRRCRDFDNAEALVLEAQNLNVTPDAAVVQKQMDLNSVMKRINDDRVMSDSIKRASLPQQRQLTGLSDAARRQVSQVEESLASARQLMAAGKTAEAERLARGLLELGIPENAFTNGDSPSRVLADIAMGNTGAAIVPSVFQTDGANASIRQVEGLELTPNEGVSNGYAYVQEAETALRAGNKEAALNNYRDALRYENELDQNTVAKVNDAIAKLTNPIASAPAPKVSSTGINLNGAPQDVQAEISAYVAKVYQVRQKDPNEGLAMLNQLKSEIENSPLDDSVRSHFLYSVDMAIADTQRFIDVNGPMIALNNQNEAVEEEIRQKREDEIQMQNRLAEDVEKFNQLIEDGKYEEAEILAKKCRDYSHNSVVSIQLVEMARIKKQVAFNDNLKASRENGWLGAMNDVESASVINVTDANPLALGPQWNRAKNRSAIENGGNRSEADLEILSKLDMRITFPFDRPMPLGTVLDYIRETMKINILQDEAALANAGITSDTPIETKLPNISLKNYLKHVLAPYNLTYVVADEVLTITDKSQMNGEIVTRVYYVADLITKIPNFNQVNSPLDMQSAFDRAYSNARRGNSANKSVIDTIPTMANNNYSNTMISPNILGQIQAAGNSVPVTAGSAGGGNDPSELIGLITSIVDPESWDIVGEPQHFNLNGSLVIRQSEQNHQEICDLLEKLRSLNDMQIAIEVRYISISDEYYEQIGVNFGATLKTTAPSTEEDDMLVPDGKGIYGISTASTGTGRPFTESLNIDFSQNSYGMAVPQFGNYDPSVGAQVGFAILSDIETYFFISASEADRRTNVLQAPKVMMFNGQTASVSDMTQVPYVYTVVPVVGDFAVAQQPVTTVINEGQFMTVQAVVLPDRRHVRMTVVPFFSTITDPDREFRFDGSDSTITSSTSSSKGNQDVASVTDERESGETSEIISAGTTIQQPIVSSFQVQTTVQVPDGGTVLLGGIKRLSEGRSEAGVPILSKIPYLKRLFSNTSIGRETTSLMMMVTPRIIIQEEEEEFLTGLTKDDFNSEGSQGALNAK